MQGKPDSNRYPTATALAVPCGFCGARDGAKHSAACITFSAMLTLPKPPKANATAAGVTPKRKPRPAAPKTAPAAAKPKRAPRKPPVFKGTREEWLEAATEILRPTYIEVGAPLPKRVKISCGWSSSGLRSASIGECWIPEASDAGVPEIFITPKLADSIEVGAVLVHELVHAAGFMDHSPKGFGIPARKLGLEGPLPMTTAGEACKAMLAGIVKAIGSYPHAELGLEVYLRRNPPKPKPEADAPADAPADGDGEAVTSTPGWRKIGGQPKQGTRMLKVVCTGCGCTLRMTRTWLDRAGTPTCGCGSPMEEAAS